LATTATDGQRTALVLGGGGLKGFAHLGVLRALEERGIHPSVLAGTSIGAMLAAAYAGGMPLADMLERARAFRRRDLFRLNHARLLLDRMGATSLYLEGPLRATCEAVCPPGDFDQLRVPLLVNTVDLERGTQVVWGLPGLRDVPVADAVYASCALPGFFPPGRVDGRVCADGGTVDNLPVPITALGTDAVIAVDVGSSDLPRQDDIHEEGFANIYMRAATMMMKRLQQFPLDRWQGPPMLLIRPRISHVGWFDFGRVDEVVAEGYRAATEALAVWDEVRAAPGGIFPRRRVHVMVDRERCTGCGICVSLAPNLMALDGHGKAYALTSDVDWSPADGSFVNQCPTNAILCDGPSRTLPIVDASDEPAVPGAAAGRAPTPPASPVVVSA
jgi:NTE family protein